MLKHSKKSHPIRSRLTASETARIALATELAATRRALWTEQVLKRWPAIEPAIDLITATDEQGFFEQAAKLASFARE